MKYLIKKMCWYQMFMFERHKVTLSNKIWVMLNLCLSVYLIFKLKSTVFLNLEIAESLYRNNRKAMKTMNRSWSNQKANPALKTKTGNKLILQIDKIQ